VGVERERAPLLRPLLNECEERIDSLAAPPVRLNRESPATEPFERLVMRWQADLKVRLYKLIEKCAQPSFGHQRRIQVAHRAGRRVARILEGGLAGVLALLVHALERLA